jgi:hypothetical protein
VLGARAVSTVIAKPFVRLVDDLAGSGSVTTSS